MLCALYRHSGAPSGRNSSIWKRRDDCCTRAKERAYITYVRMAFKWGRLQEATKSTFLEAMQSTMAFRSFPKDDVEERSGSRSHRVYWY